MTVHAFPNRKISASTYAAGCRCDGCRTANTDYIRERRRAGLDPGSVAINRATSRAAKWVRDNHPDVWRQLVDDQYARLGVDRRTVGRPAKSAS